MILLAKIKIKHRLTILVSTNKKKIMNEIPIYLFIIQLKSAFIHSYTEKINN